MKDRRKLSHRSALKLSSAASVLGVALLLSPTSALAQQTVPGTSPNCPIATIDGEQVAICEGDLEGGVTATPDTPDFDQIIIRDPDAPIAPPGFFGVGVVKDNGDLDITIEDGVVINVFDDPGIPGVAQGVIAIAQNGFDLSLDSEADITADGNGSFALGIEAITNGSGNLRIETGGSVGSTINENTIDVFTSGETAIAVQGRTESGFLQINNSAALSARSNGAGERNTVTAGILAVTTNQLSTLAIQNFGDITVETGANSFDTDFNGIAGAIVANAFNSVGGPGRLGIDNIGNLQATGPQTHGIVGFIQSADANIPAVMRIANGLGVDELSISINGVGSFGILSQGSGEAVDMTVLNSSSIDMTATGGTATGIFALNQANAGTLVVNNTGTITGTGDTVRGIGATTFAAPVDGDYVFDITNEGDITLDAPLAFGITAFATRDDNVDATITNSGNIDLSAATDVNSVGITASFGNADPNSDPTADGSNSVVINNSGDITMGAGVAIFAAADNVTLANTGTITVTPEGSDVVLIGGTESAQTVDLAFSGGDISSEAPTALFGGYAARIADATEGSAYSVSFDDMTVFGTVGLVSFGDLEDNTEISLTATDLISRFRGNDTPAILVSRFGDQSTAEFNLDRVSIEDGAGVGNAIIDLAEISENSVLSFRISNSALFSGGGDDVASLMIGGLGGANSALNVNILNTGFAFSDGTSFEIAKFAQDDSTAVLTIGRDSTFDSRVAGGNGIAIGTADVGAIDNSSSLITIEDSRVFTFGERSTGIFIDSQLDGATDSEISVQVSGVEISTNGTDAHGIEIIGARNVIAGRRVPPTEMRNDNVDSQIVIVASEDITAAGANSDAIRITNQGLTAILANNGATVSGGSGDAVAIRLAGAGSSSDAVEQITAAATATKARLADRAQNLITGFISSSAPTPGLKTVAAVGGGEAGVDPLTVDPFDVSAFSRLIEIDSATVESMMGAGVIVSDGSLAVGGMNGGIIRTGNDDAPVISAVEALAIIASDTTFSSMGDNSALFSIAEMNMGDGTFFYGDLTDIIATTSGANSDAIATGGGVVNSIGVLFVSASDLAAPSVIATSGDGSSAVSFDAPELSTFTGGISRSEISTTGLGAAAIDLNMGSTSSASLELLDTLMSTTGNGSDVVLLNTGQGTDYNFIIANSELRSEGDDSALIRVAGREGTNVGSFTMIGGTLSSMGDNSGGIITEGGPSVGGSSHTFFFGQSSITTAGQNSDGLKFGRDGDGGASIGSFTLDAVDITTGGANSDAFAIETLDDGSVLTALVTNSNLATDGDNSRAYVSEALGDGSAKSLVIGDSTLITAGANSTALLVNDMSLLDLDLNPNLQGVSSIFSFDIERSEIFTMGENSRGIDVATLLGDQSTTVISMQDNQLTTAGSNSDAISIGTQAGIGADRASHTVSIDFMDIETGGDDSRGIYIGSLANGIGSPAPTGDPENPTDATIFIGEGSVTTAGARSHGIEFATIDGDFTDAIVDIVSGTDQTIATTGDNAIGLLLGGVTGSFIDSDAGTDLRPQFSASISPLSVTTEGTGSHAIQIGDLPAFDVADNTSVTLTVLTREITTSGDGAHGVVIGSGWGEASSDTNFTDPGSNRFTTVTVDGAINVNGAGSHGIVSDSLINDFSISETGSVTSADGFALNFGAVDDGLTVLNLGTIDGDVIFGGGDDTLDNSGILTGNIDMGAGANSIIIRASGVFNSLDSILLGAGNAITVEGDLSPGDDGPFQTTSIGSDLFFEPGSRLLIDIDGMAADPNAAGFFQSDRITVDGNIVIEDATLAISSLTPEGDFDRSAQFLILDAAGTLTGKFSTIDADLPFLDLSVTYDAGQAILNAGRQGPVVPFASLGLTPNQRAVGAAFDTLEPDATGDLDDVIEQFIFASTDQALTAFDGTSGEIYASLLAQAGNDGLRRSREGLARARMAAAQGWGIWGGVSFADSSIDGDGNGADVNQDDFGFDFGIDYVGTGNRWAAGISTGLRDGDVEVAQRASSADYDMWYLAAHARYGTGGAGATFSGVFSYGETDASVTRSLTVNALSRTAIGDATMDTTAFAAEARYGWSVGGGWAIGPVVSILRVDSDLTLEDETGAGSVALTSADASDGQTRYGAGVFANLQSNAVTFDLSSQYLGARSNTVGARLAFAEGSNAPFTILAPITDESGVSAAASVRIELGEGWTLGAQIDALLGGDQQDVSGSATIGWRF